MMYRYTAIATLIICLSGCLSNNDVDFVAKAEQYQTESISQLVEQYQLSTTGQEVQKNSYLTDLVSHPQLERYLSLALANNPDLRQTLVALQIAYAQSDVSFSEQLPHVDTEFLAQYQQNSDDTYKSNLNVSWELDLWRRLGDKAAASDKQLMATAANFESATNLLAANVMRGWLEISVNQQLFDIERRRLAILENNELLVLQRYQQGLGTLEELDNAKSTTLSIRARVAQYRQQMNQSRRALILLTGEWSPNEFMQLDVSHFPQVLNPLETIGVQNLSGRPDLKEAFLSIEEKSLTAEAAYKAMLPSFVLSTTLQDMATTPSEALFTNPVWSLLGSMTAPLFQGGKLKAQEEIARLNTERSYWAYQQVLLNAVYEVETAIEQESALAEQQAYLHGALISATRSIDSYQQKYRQGLVDILDLLTVQRQAYDIESDLAKTTYQRLLNRIDLALALGLGVERKSIKRVKS
ncbi:TolC family protein [Vibrio sp. JPW-9-11-11]|uniref:TolC family protein n=1 Tax=Vibrio sp. JPW-9-11-11 TaxID=1416532 RepID=UPI0015940B07|nr:TolC family protein [Vibrio sp. JPW-9-11-11]NVD09026.1 TolC family protein [Vibrio sp. JPW-9-11-11]